MRPPDHLSPEERADFLECQAEHLDLTAQLATREAQLDNGVIDSYDEFAFDDGPLDRGSSAHLSDFAVAVAARLPGLWRAEHHIYPEYRDQFAHTEQVWDLGLVDGVVSEFVLDHAATLHGPDKQRLYIIDRPMRRHQFLVAPLEPEGYQPHHFGRVREPDGIAVPGDPARAAAALTRRLLPRYHLALAALERAAVAEPDPPHRPHAAEPDRRFALVLYADGAVGAPESSVPAEAHDTLYACRFQYQPHEAAFLLPAAYSDTERAVLLQAAVQRLTTQGIGVDFRHAAPAPARSTPRPAPAPLPVLASSPAAPRSR